MNKSKISIYWIAIAICVIFAVVMCLYISTFWLTKPQIVEYRFKIELIGDSLNVTQSQLHVTDSLVSVLEKQEAQLNTNYELFMKARQDDADLTKIISCLGAFVIAIFGMLGVKSFKDALDKIRDESSEKIRKIVTEKSPGIIAEQFKVSIQNDQYFIQLKDKIYNELNAKIIDQFDNRLAKIESKLEGTEFNANSDSSSKSDEEPPVFDAPLPQ